MCVKALLLCRSLRWKGYGGLCSSYCDSRFARTPGFGLPFGEMWRRSRLFAVGPTVVVLHRVLSWSVVGCHPCGLRYEELKGEVCGDRNAWRRKVDSRLLPSR